MGLGVQVVTKYKYLTVHCSATLPLDSIDAETIRKMHIDKGWSDIGYHYVIKANGSVQRGRSISRVGAHVKGHNENNLGVCMVGGVDENGKSCNNFTSAQYSALRWFIIQQVGIHGIKQENIMGHRS
jgi:hypothetical protein